MRDYRSIEVSEKQFEDLVRQAPGHIEAGLTFVAQQAFTDRGRLDVLMVDDAHCLVIAELKVHEDDMMLTQGIDYYDYVIGNLEGYARAYSQHEIDPHKEPRLFLIAPSFSVTLLNRVKWIDITDVSLFTYKCIEFSDTREVVAVYMEVIAPDKRPGPVGPYSVDDRYAYITDLKVRSLAQKVVEEIKGWDPGVVVEPIKNAVSIKHSGSVIAYVEPGRKHFVLSTYNEEGKWTRQNISDETDVANLLPVVSACFKRKARPAT